MRQFLQQYPLFGPNLRQPTRRPFEQGYFSKFPMPRPVILSFCRILSFSPLMDDGACRRWITTVSFFHSTLPLAIAADGACRRWITTVSFFHSPLPLAIAAELCGFA